jgi:pimeloyl-ACP methyl ester carboxylesterase
MRGAAMRSIRMLGLLTLVWLTALPAAAAAAAPPEPLRPPRLPFVAERPDFSAAAVAQGLVAQRADCQAGAGPGELLWAEDPEHGAECLRAWTAGFVPGAPNPRAVVFFEGDVWGHQGVPTVYSSLTTAALEHEVAARARQLGLPYLMLGRPGVFGSSGDHMQRRRPAESALVSRALDVFAVRHGVAEWVLVGQSGGGHVAASLLVRRRDVLCAVLASTPASPRVRWWLLGYPHDSTGYADSFEPLDQLRREGHHPRLRIVVLGDRADRNTPWASQELLVGRAQALGLHARAVPLRGEGTMRHGLEEAAHRAARSCARGESDARLVERARGTRR